MPDNTEEILVSDLNLQEFMGKGEKFALHFDSKNTSNHSEFKKTLTVTLSSMERPYGLICVATKLRTSSIYNNGQQIEAIINNFLEYTMNSIVFASGDMVADHQPLLGDQLKINMPNDTMLPFIYDFPHLVGNSLHFIVSYLKKLSVAGKEVKLAGTYFETSPLWRSFEHSGKTDINTLSDILDPKFILKTLKSMPDEYMEEKQHAAKVLGIYQWIINLVKSDRYLNDRDRSQIKGNLINLII